TAAVCDQEALARRGEVVQLFSRFGVIYHRADGRLKLDRPPFVSGAIAALPMASALSLVLGVETEVKQSVLVLTGDEINIAAATAVAPARTSARDILFAPKSQTSIAAVASLYVDPDFVNEHWEEDVGCRKSDIRLTTLP